MDLHGADFRRSARAPAKLNLFLDVLGARGDGFHDIETLMVPIRLADQVAFTPLPAAANDRPGPILLDVRTAWPVRPPPQQPDVPTGWNNLIVRSLELLRERSGCMLGARVELIKRIPMAAGLGGGSSDSAAALRLANQAWQIKWSKVQLAELSAELGSDIPFFLSQGPAVCRGRGERIERLAPLPTLHFVVVKPADALTAGAVYGAFDSLASSDSPIPKRQLSRLVSSLYQRSWHAIGAQMHNQLQSAASLLAPYINRLCGIFSEFDFIGHQLTGSGSAYFGLCRHAQHARRLASILRTRQLGLVYATRSCQ